MSLINDALKKAQKQRTGDSPPLTSLPSVGGESPAKIAKRDKPAGINTQLVRLGVAGGAIVLVVVVGGIFLIRSFRSGTSLKPPTTAPSSSEVGSVVPAAPSSSPPPATAHETPPPAEPTVSFRLPAAPPVTAPPEPATEAGRVIPGAPTSAPPVETVAPSTPPAPPPTMDAKALNYIDNLRIAGIRAAGADSKVLMNDRVFRVGDMVDRDLGLKLTGITANSLTFVDPNGASYTRQF
ncbi:MAG TPA: hypothetical protein VL200_17385 [Lacunisphaera sp.]|jgi:hypothetical protein|nr:hypothetical protein [Lacunisphaera sp.]